MRRMGREDGSKAVKMSKEGEGAILGRKGHGAPSGSILLPSARSTMYPCPTVGRPTQASSVIEAVREPLLTM